MDAERAWLDNQSGDLLEFLTDRDNLRSDEVTRDLQGVSLNNFNDIFQWGQR
jgi:hypothetical protein